MWLLATSHETDLKWIAVAITLVLVVFTGGVLSPLFYRRRRSRLKRRLDSAPEADRPAIEKQLDEIEGHTGWRQALGLAFGADDRLSTSKTMAVAWTIVVAYVLIALLLILPGNGWDKALKNVWPTYLLLLGGPYAGLVLAKAAVTTKLNNGTLQKTKGDGTPRLGDLVGGDDGQPDVTDFQYLVFNLIAIAFVIDAFVHDATDGFPDIPVALALLTGGPLAVYVGSKTLESNAASLTAVSPEVVHPNEPFTLYGQNLVPPGGNPPTLTVEDAKLEVLAGSSDTALPVKLVQPTDALRRRSGDALDVVAVTDVGARATLGGKLRVLLEPLIEGLDRTTASTGDEVTVSGAWGKAASPIVKVGAVTAKTGTADPGRSIAFTVPQLPRGTYAVTLVLDGQTSAAVPLRIT